MNYSYCDLKNRRNILCERLRSENPFRLGDIVGGGAGSDEERGCVDCDRHDSQVA